MSVCLSVHICHMYAGDLEGQKKISDPLVLELQMAVSHSVWMLFSKWGPLGEQHAILTTVKIIFPVPF